MAIKKSELYSTLWASCDKLRGGMDASQYKDYVLVLLFVKYVSDKYTNNPDGSIIIPIGGGFQDMIALKGQKEIGDRINTIIGELAKANDLVGVIDVADFNDSEKLGKGKEMVDKLTGLIQIFENPSLDFGKNKAEGDDILGDAYEYLMSHFATESGKSKGQFYTPSEVSKVMAKVLGIQNSNNATTFYDPTCGSGSLLLKALDESDGKGTIYGQEKDTATGALAKMNMILHGQEAVEIHRGQSTLSDPYFKDNTGKLKTFDYIVANPPFSLKNWTDGFSPANDTYQRFDKYGTPPDKNGDYAFLLHILKSLKSTGKAAIVLPHGVLFRGNSEAVIRKSLIQQGYIKGIIGLPANLFYGTGIPACLIIIDKEKASPNRSIFMIDASKGFIKDGNKNRLRDQDIHSIVDSFNRQIEIPKYSRLIPISEISDPKNDYNLNIPRYIDSQQSEDIQDLTAHLNGGIPNLDIEELSNYWSVYPSLKSTLFEPISSKYSTLKVNKDDIKTSIFQHKEFSQFSQAMDNLFSAWQIDNTTRLKNLSIGIKPKEVITELSENILNTYSGKPLMDQYAVYQHIMDYWNTTMQDDIYLIAVEGWKANPTITKETRTETQWECDLVPKSLVINKYLKNLQTQIEELESERETIATGLTELIEEHNTEDCVLNNLERINKASATKQLKTFNTPKLKTDNQSEILILNQYLQLTDQLTNLNSRIKSLNNDLDNQALDIYSTLTIDEIKELVVEDKWMKSIEVSVKTEMDGITQRLTGRVKELASRYEKTMNQITTELSESELKVNNHLQSMGLVW